MVGWETLFFWFLTVGALGTSVAMVSFRNPLYSALALIVDFFCFAGLYVMLSAHFMAVTQVLVYAGAIMVLFVFIIMLLNLGDEELGARKFNLHHLLAIGGGLALFTLIAISVDRVVDLDEVRSATADQRAAAAEQAGEGGDTTPPPIAVESNLPGLYSYLNEPRLDRIYHDQLRAIEEGERKPWTDEYRPYNPDANVELPSAISQTQKIPAGAARNPEAGLFGTVEPISLLLVNRYVVPFELTAILLLAAIVGAVVIAKKRL
jgi:NADH-quinone oxidoreductase subunit J